jgi:ATP-dependent Clp protease ATP-binding subunit ClpB
LQERKVTLELTKEAREALFQEGYDPAFGARPLKRAIQKLIADPLALKLLSGEIESGDDVQADVGKTGEFVFHTVPAKAS